MAKRTTRQLIKTIFAEVDDSDGSGEPDEVEDGDDEALPTKSELEWMILQYLQPIHRYPLKKTNNHRSIKWHPLINQHRQLADLHSRLATVEEKLGGEGTVGSGEEESKSRMPREN